MTESMKNKKKKKKAKHIKNLLKIMYISRYNDKMVSDSAIIQGDQLVSIYD